MPTGKVLWGAASSGLHYENELVLGYSLYEPLDDRAPRAGSEWVQAPSGVEDAWITGQDYVLHCEVRWIPDGPASTPQRSPIAGPNSWSQFLDYARAKNVFRFVPDASLPNFFVDGVYLVEPTSGLGKLDDTKLLRNVPLTFRQAAVPWTQAVVRRVAVEYAPGQPTTGTGLDASFSRPSSAWYVSKAGVLTSLPSSVPRDRNYRGSTTPSLLLEYTGVNVVQWSQGASQWTPVSTGGSVTPNADVAPDGTTTAELITPTLNNWSFRSLGQRASGTTSAVVHSVFVKWVGPGSTHITTMRVLSSSGLSFGRLNASWSTLGVPTPTLSEGALAVGAEAQANGWYRLYVSGVPASSGLATAAQFYPDINLGTNAVEWWGAQLEDGQYPTSPIPCTGAAPSTRQADSWLCPIPVGFQTPQPLWAYVKFTERGAIASTGAPGLLVISTTAGTVAPEFQLLVHPGTVPTYRCSYVSASGGLAAAIMSTASARPSFGDTVELLGQLSSSGGVTLLQCINGGAEVASAAPTAAPGVASLASSWSGPSLWLASLGAAFEILTLKMGPGSKATLAAARSA